MRNPIRRSTLRAVIIALLGAVLAASTVLTALAPSAGAAGGAPPWEPDANSVGGLLFYNAAGQQVTGGNLTDSPVAAYVEGTGRVRAGDTKATLYGYVPVAVTPPTLPTPGSWSGEALGSSTTYPNASAPAPINTSTLPVQTGSSGDETIATLMSDLPNTNAVGSGYENLYQLRLKTTQAGQQPNVKYDSADISIDSTNGTWSVVYPALTPTATTTTLTTAPTSPQASGTSVTLTATVSPAAPGTVQFENGTTAIGSPVTVTGGVATLPTTALPVGSLTLHAVFTPAQFADYAGSTGTASYTVYTPVSTTTTLTTAPTSPQVSGTSVTLTATLSPSAATGTVQFENGSMAIGAPATVTAGVATLATAALPVGSLTLHAVYTPTGVYLSSTGTASYTITNPTNPTTTTLTASPVSPQLFGTSETLTATVSPVATGTVQFENGTTAIGAPATVTGGVATLATAALPVGSLTLNAVFIPTPGNGFGGSTGTAPFTVNANPTTTTLTASPVSPQLFGTSETLTATVSPVATGTVQFENGTTALVAPATVSGGVATLVTSALPVGSLTLNAVFTPTAGNGFASSTGTTPFTVNPIPTTTTLTASPVSPQFFGTSETLTAAVSPVATGTVQFENGTTAIGAPATVSGGVATLVTSALPVGSLTLNAVFTPTAGNGFVGSTGTTPFTVNPVTPTTTTLTASPPSPQLFGTSVTLTATVSRTATGTVQFQNGATDLGGPVTVNGSGVATLVTSALPVGTLSLLAVFAPTAGNGFGASNGTASFTVNPNPTTTTLTASPASPQFFGTSVTLTASVSPSAAGRVQFENGTTAIGAPATVTAGVATLVTTALPVGSLTLNAVFTPTAGNGFAGSTGTTNYTVTPLTGTTTSLVVAPAGPQLIGTSVTLTATVSPTAMGTVQFENGTTVIGGPVAVTAGVATLVTTALPPGALTLRAVFTPTAGNGFAGSTGSSPFTVTGHSGSAVTPDGKGYWLVATDGGIFAYGDADFYGSTGGQHLNAPIVGMATTADGKGYWLVATDGGIFAYGDAAFYGSTGGQHLNAPIVSLSPTPDSTGYWLAAADGGVFTFGDATFHGSAGGAPINAPVVGSDPTPDGNGYWLFAADGGVFAYGDAGYFGSAAGLGLTKPII
jgi:hypothetical protein